MKTMLRAALIAISIGSVSPAFAESEGGTVANSYFTSLPGVVSQAPEQNASAISGQSGQSVGAYVTNSSHGTWLFPPHTGNG
jgi:hypothetical protein